MQLAVGRNAQRPSAQCRDSIGIAVERKPFIDLLWCLVSQRARLGGNSEKDAEVV